MRRRTKKNVRKRGPARPAFDDGDWGPAPEAEPVAETEPATDGGPAETVQAVRTDEDPLEAFLANYTPPRPKKSRVMVVAVAVSAALHISTVTLFSIVIYFPREDIQYYDFRFVPLGQAAVTGASGEMLRTPGGEGLRLGGGFDSVLGEESVMDRFPARPAVQLPTLELATLDRLRLRQTAVDERAAYDRLFGAGPQDSWARFGQSISRVRDVLAGTEPGALPSVASSLPGVAADATVIRPADGFEALVSWDSPANRRELLFSPPIQSLYDASGEILSRGIEVVFEVNATGRVINVWSSTVDETGVVDDIQATLLQYRFEPVREGQREQASGVIRIRRSEPAP